MGLGSDDDDDDDEDDDDGNGDRIYVPTIVSVLGAVLSNTEKLSGKPSTSAAVFSSIQFSSSSIVRMTTSQGRIYFFLAE